MINGIVESSEEVKALNGVVVQLIQDGSGDVRPVISIQTNSEELRPSLQRLGRLLERLLNQ